MNVKQLLLAKTGSPIHSPKLEGMTAPHEHYPSGASSTPKSSEKSLTGEAELLLSFANIARCEITDHPRALDGLKHSKKFHLPLLPYLANASSSTTQQEPEVTSLAPRTESILSTFKPLPAPSRLRAVSFDAHFDSKLFRSRTPSPLTCKAPSIVSPDTNHRRARSMIRSTRQSHRARRRAKTYEDDDEDDDTEDDSIMEDVEDTVVPPSPKKPSGGRLQAKPPSGVEVTTIHRRKFSWKNYPELEQFLVANREEYLRHSALNYTIQQKQYNNRLTDRLLEIASEHGYLFSTKDFNFVTVRDRIRCFYKSYVQSAKKRGILMGYAARKAGLISEDDLISAVDGEIITPACS